MRVLGFGFWVLGFGFWVLGFGFWVLGFGFWVLGFGFWVLGFGFWGQRSWVPVRGAVSALNKVIATIALLRAPTITTQEPYPKP